MATGFWMAFFVVPSFIAGYYFAKWRFKRKSVI